jgi:nicotinamidase-related amidase
MGMSQNLRTFFNQISKAVLLNIDVQAEYCDPEHLLYKNGNATTVEAASKIAEITPKFRQAGLRPYWAFRYAPKFYKNQAPTKFPRFYQNTPEEEDGYIPKQGDCAFREADINTEQELKEQAVDCVIISGVNAGACVMKTVEGALRAGFKVCVLRDAVANDNSIESGLVEENLAAMEKMGARIASSDEVLQVLKDKQSCDSQLRACAL